MTADSRPAVRTDGPRALGGPWPTVEVRPKFPFHLQRWSGLDGLTRVRAGVLNRLVPCGELVVPVRVAQPAPDRVVFAAGAADRAAAEWAIERMRMALGVDQDLMPFYERFRFDPLIGAGVRAAPGLRVTGKPDPFEALAWAICEQLIEVERAAEIQRRIAFGLGPRCEVTGLRCAPSAAVVAAQSPARLEAFGLSGGRAVAVSRAAREVAAGRIDLYAAEPAVQERGWQRLYAIRGIGRWTVQKLALTGQGRLDQLPAADLAYLKLVGRLRTGDPWARAEEAEVVELFSRYEPYAGLAGAHALRLWGKGGLRGSRAGAVSGGGAAG